MSENDKITEPTRLPSCLAPKSHETLEGRKTYLESLKGYLLRHASLNGYGSLRYIYQLAGFKGPPGSFRKVNLASLCELVDQSESILRELTYKRTGRGRVKFLGYDFPSNVISHSHPKICVECLVEDLIFPAIWDLSLFIACPKHKCYLIDECPSCNKPLNWLRPEWFKCFCGFDLRNAVLKKAIDDVLEIMDLTIKSLHIVNQTSLKTLTIDLLKLSPGDLQSALAVIGCWHTKRYSIRIDKSLFQTNLQQKIEIVSAAYNTLLDWPNNFFVFLSQNKLKEQVTPKQTKLLNDFGILYATLIYMSGREAKNFFSKAFIAFDLQDRDANGHVDQRFFGYKRKGLCGAAFQAGLSLISLQKMVASGGVTLKVIGLPNFANVVRVEDDSLKDLLNRIPNRMYIKQLGLLLGIGSRTTSLLRKDGCFTEDAKTIWDGRTDVTFDLNEVTNLLKMLNDKATTLPKASLHGTIISIMECFTYHCSQDFTRKDVIHSILEGKIKLYSNVKKANFKNFYISRNDMYSCLFAKIAGEKTELLHFSLALTKYCLSAHSLGELIKRNAIKYEKIESGGKYYTFIFEDTLKKFLNDNIMLSSVAKNLRMHPGSVRGYLSGQGIEPLWPRQPNEGGIIWYSALALKRKKSSLAKLANERYL